MSTRDYIMGHVPVIPKQAWKVEENVYTVRANARNAFIQNTLNRIDMRAYYRRGDEGTRWDRETARLNGDYYKPGHTYDQWYDRGARRLGAYFDKHY